MLRLRQLFRNPLLFFRLDPPNPKHPGAANTRNVKFKRPWVRNFLNTCILYGVASHLWSSLVVLQLDDREDDADSPELTQRGTGAHAGDGKAHQKEKPTRKGAVFVPLGWPRLQEPKFYASSDPEWQQYVSISKDSKKLQSLRDELAAVVLENMSQSDQIQHVLGGPLTMTGYWLIHHFPYRAPPTYERSGLAIRGNSISWVSRSISQEDGDRLLRILQPLSVALGVRDAYLVFLKKQLNRLKDFGHPKGLSSESPNMLSGGTALSPEQTNVDGLSQISQPSTRTPDPSGLQEDVSEDQENSQSLLMSSLQRLPLLELGPGSDLQEVSEAFKKSIKFSWVINDLKPHRGAFLVAGPVGIRGPKGFCRVEVRGEYDPATASWLTIFMDLRDISVFKQRALGDK